MLLLRKADAAGLQQVALAFAYKDAWRVWWNACCEANLQGPHAKGEAHGLRDLSKHRVL